MKIKSSFITNSSSSSFVIAIKEYPHVDQEDLKKYPFLSGYVDLIKSLLDSGEILENKNDVLDALYGVDEDYLTDYEVESYNNVVSAIENGDVMLFDFDNYEDDGKIDVLMSLRDSGNIEIIYEG